MRLPNTRRVAAGSPSHRADTHGEHGGPEGEHGAQRVEERERAHGRAEGARHRDQADLGAKGV